MLSPSEPQPEIELEKNWVLPQEAIWPRLVVEAKEAAERDPALVSLYSSILKSPSLEEAMARRLAARLASAALPAGPLAAVLLEPLRADPSIAAAVCADLTAVVERDPASGRLLEPFLFFKGFASIEAHRLAHWFWMGGRRDMAYYLQSQASEVFQTDIHPAARFGKGIFLDHATGFVVGETAEIEDNVSILHGVTLGGSGIEKGRRHPRVRTGVLIGAGAQILGGIEIGEFSKIAAGTLVTQSVPPRCTAVGVPARFIQGAGSANPAKTMDQNLAGGTYKSFNYVI